LRAGNRTQGYPVCSRIRHNKINIRTLREDWSSRVPKGGVNLAALL